MLSSLPWLIPLKNWSLSVFGRAWLAWLRAAPLVWVGPQWSAWCRAGRLPSSWTFLPLMGRPWRPAWGSAVPSLRQTWVFLWDPVTTCSVGWHALIRKCYFLFRSVCHFSFSVNKQFNIICILNSSICQIWQIGCKLT